MSDQRSPPLIAVSGLSRQFGEYLAVDNISFELHKNQVLGFLGPNGAGKSTTMQMLSGCLAPSAGKIEINGIDLLENPLEAKQQLGFLPEQPPLYTEFTVDEYLNFCAKTKRINKKQISTAVDTAKQRCGLTDTSKRLIGNLSKGYQQRIGIAQAIIHNPRIIIFDEPTVGLDPIQIQEIRQLIKDISADHGIIISTHILPEVEITCSAVQIMREGKLVFSESIDNINQQRASRITIGLQNPPAINNLASIQHVISVEQLDSTRYRIHFHPDNSPAEAIIKASIEQNWKLFELRPELSTLEQVFVTLINSDQSV